VIDVRRNRLAHVAALSLCVLPLDGSATVRTLVYYKPGDPVLLSGARLDAAAIGGDRVTLGRFHADPPAWPWLDLPFSFVADMFFWILPRKAGTSGSE